jgi:vacuolar-type H+-ATPase subunit E/Vma4
MSRETTPGALIDAMEKQAADERLRIRREAEESAARTIAAADAECARITAEALARLDRELAVERQRLVGEAVMAARAERLRMKRRLLAEVWSRAEAEIGRRAAGPGARAALDRLAAEAKAAVGEPCLLTVRTEDASVLASSPDGRRSVDNGLAARLRRARAMAEHEVARLLFGGRTA